jgi:outer membrane protein OmpA-like peptidoglycan-associated protein
MFSALQRVKTSDDGPLGPGSDLLAALLGTFILLTVSIKEGLNVRPFQDEMIISIKKGLGASMKEDGDKAFKLYGGRIGSDTVEIHNEGTIQYFNFGANILFNQKDDKIDNAVAKNIIRIIGDSIKANIENIKEIQIIGHADNTANDIVNLDLAARRAMTIFWMFKGDSKIDPHEHLMSITSFGEYKPFNRKEKWNSYLTGKANEDDIDKNRRIEIVLVYKEKATIQPL